MRPYLYVPFWQFSPEEFALAVHSSASGKGEDLITEQGTGFFLDGVGLVTCAHVLKPGLKAFGAQESHRQYDAKVRQQ